MGTLTWLYYRGWPANTHAMESLGPINLAVVFGGWPAYRVTTIDRFLYTYMYSFYYNYVYCHRLHSNLVWAICRWPVRDCRPWRSGRGNSAPPSSTHHSELCCHISMSTSRPTLSVRQLCDLAFCVVWLCTCRISLFLTIMNFVVQIMYMHWTIQYRLVHACTCTCML